MSKYIVAYGNGKPILVKRPKNSVELPFRTKVERFTLILSQKPHPVVSSRLLFEIKEYENNNLINSHSISGKRNVYNPALRTYKKLVAARKKQIIAEKRAKRVKH